MTSLTIAARCALALAMSFLFAACGSDPEPARLCTPGASVACVGAGGCAGGQVCNAAGSALGACECGTVDAGPVDAGPGDSGTVDGGQVDANVADMSGPDGGLRCDPFTHAGCATGERCTWAALDPEPGMLRCVPDGTVAAGGACTTQSSGPLRGTDDCMRGSYCIDFTCAALCDPADAARCSGDSCVIYAGAFSNFPDPAIAGVCVQSCDVLTQLRRDGMRCATREGCYQGGAEFTCAPATRTLVHGDPIVGRPYVNACAPGFTPGLAADGSNVCYAHCRPVETHSGAPGGAAGLSPYSCPERGAPSPNECRFGSFFSRDSDRRTDRVGVCFDRTGRTYDHDGVPGTAELPVPSCTTLANTDTDGDGIADHLRWGCAPQP